MNINKVFFSKKKHDFKLSLDIKNCDKTKLNKIKNKTNIILKSSIISKLSKKKHNLENCPKINFNYKKTKPNNKNIKNSNYKYFLKNEFDIKLNNEVLNNFRYKYKNINKTNKKNFNYNLTLNNNIKKIKCIPRNNTFSKTKKKYFISHTQFHIKKLTLNNTLKIEKNISIKKDIDTNFCKEENKNKILFKY